jgi:tetraacyldisaccharide 4'-kinase
VIVNGRAYERQGAIRMDLEPQSVVSLADGSRLPLSAFAGRDVVAAAAIGNPERFFAMLRVHGLRIETRTLPDHAAFTPQGAGTGQGKPVLLTEKDAVKCTGRGWDGAAYVEVEAVVDAAAAGPLLESIVRQASRKQGADP